MPRSDSAAPRNMFPPPTTAATWMPSSAAAVIPLAMCITASGEMPSGSPPANASPDSFSTTRCQPDRTLPPLVAELPRASAALSVTATTFHRLPRPSARPSFQAPRMTGVISTCLADLEPGKTSDARAALGEQLLDRLLLDPDGLLLGQHDVLEERVQAALHDLGDRLLRLALFAGQLLGDPALVRHQVLWHLVTADILRPHGRDLMRQVLRDLGTRLIHLDQDAESRRQAGVRLVQVARDIAALEPGEPADVQLLLERGASLLDELGSGAARPHLKAEHREPVRRACSPRGPGNVGRHLLEQVSLCDEVRLAVELEEHAGAGAVQLRGDQAVGGGPLGPLIDILGALDPQGLNRGLVIAARIHERVLAVEHARAGLLAKPLHVSGAVVRHFLISRYLV